jgi:hypothetical protein
MAIEVGHKDIRADTVLAALVGQAKYRRDYE